MLVFSGCCLFLRLACTIAVVLEDFADMLCVPIVALLLLLQANMAGGWRCHAEPLVVAEAGVTTGAVVMTGAVMTTGAHHVEAGER